MANKTDLVKIKTNLYPTDEWIDLPGASVQKMPDLWTDGGVNCTKVAKRGTVSPYFATFLDRRYAELRSVCQVKLFAR